MVFSKSDSGHKVTQGAVAKDLTPDVVSLTSNNNSNNS